MMLQYAKIDGYDGRGEFLIMFNDADKTAPYVVQHRFYAAASYGYGVTKHRKTLAKCENMKSALLYISQLFPNN